MGFPLTIAGTVKLAAATPGQASDLAEQLAKALIANRATDVRSSGNSVTFRGGMFRFVTNWNLLVPVTSGTITVASGSPGSVDYCFSCMQMLIFATAFSLLVLVFFASPPRAPLAFDLLAPIGAWAWLFGANYLLAYFRLSGFIRDVIAGSTTLVSD